MRPSGGICLEKILTGLNLAGALVTVTVIVSRELELLGSALSSGAERETEVALVSIFFRQSKRKRKGFMLASM